MSGLPMMCYPNCLVWDEGILMPSYDLPALDELARARLEQASGKKVYLVRGGAILGYGNSGPHCLSLELRH
jgi:agmatine/peptidylarginine deiminase